LEDTCLDCFNVVINNDTALERKTYDYR